MNARTTSSPLSFWRLFALLAGAEALFGAAAYLLLVGCDLDDPEVALPSLAVVGLLLAALAAYLLARRQAPAPRSGTHEAAPPSDESSLFCMMAAHELRTPLAVILAQTQHTLMREREAPDYRAALERSRQAALKLEGLLGSLQRLSRVETGIDAPRTEELAVVVGRIFETLGHAAQERGIRLHSTVPTSGLPVDEDLLEVVLANLTANAIHHGNSGGGVWIEAVRETKLLKVSVRDDGPGIPNQELCHVFEPFFRGENRPENASARLGLGLAIVQRLLTRRGGSVAVRQAQPQGSVFEISLPALGTP